MLITMQSFLLDGICSVNMKYVCHISGGIASAASWILALERYGECDAVFADTNNEDEYLYHFLNELEMYTGIEITRLDQGCSIWDIFKKKTAFTNGSTCLGAYYLKHVALENYMLRTYNIIDLTILIGFSPDEDDRIERIKNKNPMFTFDFPLLWGKGMFRCDIIKFLMDRGIKIPRLYSQGYGHNNCCGACIMAGISQWSRLLNDRPDKFAIAEETEIYIINKQIERNRKIFTILKDRRNNEIRAYPLIQLRRDIKSGRRIPNDSWRSGHVHA